MSKLYGDWKKVRPRLKMVSKDVTKEAIEKLRDLAEQYIALIRYHVEHQDLTLAPLSPITVRLKQDDRWWIDSGKFLEKLGIRVVYKGTKTVSVSMGPFPDVKYNDDFNMEQLAALLEYGGKNIPARPLFRMTDEEFNLNLRKLNKEYSQHFEIIWNK